MVVTNISISTENRKSKSVYYIRNGYKYIATKFVRFFFVVFLDVVSIQLACRVKPKCTHFVCLFVGIKPEKLYLATFGERQRSSSFFRSFFLFEDPT